MIYPPQQTNAGTQHNTSLLLQQEDPRHWLLTSSDSDAHAPTTYTGAPPSSGGHKANNSYGTTGDYGVAPQSHSHQVAAQGSRNNY